jgi:hypothetical protein
VASRRRNFPIGSNTSFSLIAIIIASSILLTSYIVVQRLTEQNVRDALLEQQNTRQREYTDNLAHVITSDIDRVVKSVQLLAKEPLLQEEQFAGSETTALLEGVHGELGTFTTIHAVSLLDKNDIIINFSPKGSGIAAIGLDRSDHKYVAETRRTMQPYISQAFTSPLGEYVIAVCVPIVNRETGEYLGMVATLFPVVEFFEAYNDFPPSSIIAFDREGAYISVTVPELLGQNYFGESCPNYDEG